MANILGYKAVFCNGFLKRESTKIINVYQKKGCPESRIPPKLGQPFKCFLRLFYLVAILHAYNDLIGYKGVFPIIDDRSAILIEKDPIAFFDFPSL